MEKKSRILEGLKRCSTSDDCGPECPYAYGEESEPGKLCIQDLCRDALELINAQGKELRAARKMARRIQDLHCCLDCTKNENCRMRPSFMSDVRLNCPQWEGGAAVE